MIAVAQFWLAFVDIFLGVLGSLAFALAVLFGFGALDDDDGGEGLVIACAIVLIVACLCFAGVATVEGVR